LELLSIGQQPRFFPATTEPDWHDLGALFDGALFLSI